MAVIILNSILFVAALLALSFGIDFREKSKDKEAASKYIMFCLAYAVNCIAYILTILSQNTTVEYVCYSVAWFAWIVFLADSVLLAAYSVDCSKKAVSVSVTFILYWGMGLYFIDTLIGKGELYCSKWAVYYRPTAFFHIFLHSVIYIVYIAVLIAICVYFIFHCNKKRDFFQLFLFAVTFFPFVIGILLEMLVLIFEGTFLPFSQFFGLCTVWVLRRLLRYHRSMELSRDDYKEWLSADRTDVVLICDDTQKVIFVNKRAEITAQMLRENYVGRKLADIFLLSSDAEAELKNPENKGTFWINAIYPPADRKVSFVVRRVLDRYDEIFAGIVTVYNMEDVKEDNIESMQTEEIEIEKQYDEENVLNITKAADVLIVDENIIRLNAFERMLKPYQMHVTRALGGGKAIGLLKENFYDIIFIDHKMSKINGLDAAKIIRAMPGEYYKTVPLVFCTDEKMDNIYKDFLEAGFSDYLLYPISVKHLSLVLTRWVWKKLEKQEALRKEEEVWDGNHREIEVLLNDSLMFYEKKNMMLFSFCIRGIKQMSMIIGSSNAEELAREAGNAILFEDMDMLEETYMELVKVLKALLKENGEA